MSKKQVFIAYPSSPNVVGEVIETAAKKSEWQPNLNVVTWKRDDLAGQDLIQPILEAIRNSDIVAADITGFNFNVIYELGFAVGLGKRTLPVRYTEHAGGFDLAKDIGILDTLLHEAYTNSDQLLGLLFDADLGRRIATDFPREDHPLFILLPPARTDDVSNLLAYSEKAGLRRRVFDPSEHARLSASQAARFVASSYGVVVPLLSPNDTGANEHNVRAAFVAGISHALEKPTLIIKRGSWPAPLDIRHATLAYDSFSQLKTIVGEFAPQVHNARYHKPPRAPGKQNFLAKLNLGDPAAENEEQHLDDYFLEREEFRRVLNGRANIVVGRKGSGKTAIFMQVRDRLRASRANVIVDLNPEAYQLLRLKDLVLRCLAIGTKEALLIAFWEYVLQLEICAKLLEKDKEVHKRDHSLFTPYQRLRKYFDIETDEVESGFAERLNNLIERIGRRFDELYGTREELDLTDGEVMKLLYKGPLHELRREVAEYAQHKDEVVVLFDNLDKSWNATGLAHSDVVMIRTLLEANRKLRREFERKNVKFRSIVFLRNDIYDILLSDTPDRGKESPAQIDWNNADLLKQVLRNRLIFNAPASHSPSHQSIEELWHSIGVPVVNGEHTLSYLIDRCLMRPRYLIRLLEHCIGNAINFGREQIDGIDIENGLSTYSTDTITEIDLEIRDVLPSVGKPLYVFLGEPRKMTRSRIESLLTKAASNPKDKAALFALLLWHGVIGIVRHNDQASFIFDVNNDLQRLMGLIEKHPETDPVMIINPAFWPGLEMH